MTPSYLEVYSLVIGGKKCIIKTAGMLIMKWLCMSFIDETSKKLDW